MSVPAYKRPQTLRALANFIFWTRWLQAPLYVGLIVAQAVYVYHFWLSSCISSRRCSATRRRCGF
jgi:uncharacterized membrane protein YqhA